MKSLMSVRLMIVSLVALALTGCATIEGGFRYEYDGRVQHWLAYRIPARYRNRKSFGNSPSGGLRPAAWLWPIAVLHFATLDHAGLLDAGPAAEGGGAAFSSLTAFNRFFGLVQKQRFSGNTTDPPRAGSGCCWGRRPVSSW